MIELQGSVFKAVDIENESGNTIRVEEGFKVRLTVTQGEVFEGVVTKLEAKKITIHLPEEIGERVFGYGDVEDIEVL